MADNVTPNRSRSSSTGSASQQGAPHANSSSSSASRTPSSDTQHRDRSARSSVYDTFGGASSEPGKSPFGFGFGDKSAATYLAQAYERMMKDNASIHSSGNNALTGEIDEPSTYVFIFTNPRSGNQQGRSLMSMALRNFRLRDRPEVQVQIYDVTHDESQKEGLHYLHQLQLRQGDRLLKTAFPELLNGSGEHIVRPSPSMCPRSHGSGPCSHDHGDSSKGAWDEWITEAAGKLESGLSRYSDEEITQRLQHAQESAIKLHVWSAGGDGTVSATIQAMFDNDIDVNRVYFSCIPFGTGNDFADALGWGRSVPGNAVGESMKLLNKIITERLDGYTCKLDIYEMTFTTYDDGHIKHVSKDMFKQPGMKRYSCLMIDYFSLGVQGFVGSSFELHRPGKRALNILMYTAASAKWVFMKKFPPINEALESISTVPEAMKQDTKLTDEDRARWLEQASEADRKQVMMFRVAGPKTHCHGRKMGWAKEPKARHMCTASDFGEGIDADLPVIRSKPIEIDIQNVARFWGRNIDVWNNPHKEDSAGSQLSNRNGVTDSTNWTPQYAGDGKVELFSVKDIGDYALNQMPGRSDYRINRLAQMASPLALHFRAPEDYPPRTNNPLTSRKNIEQGLLYGMCDGEFIELYHPRDIVISRKVTLKAIGRSPETSRIVLDTIKNDGLDAVQMDATAAADTTQSGRPADVNNYVASPFQRIFKFSRRQTGASNTSATTGGDSTSARSSTGQLLKSPVLAAVSGGPSRSSSTARRSTFNSIRNSMLFRSGSLSRSRKTSFNESDASGTTVTSPLAKTFSLSNAVHHDSPLKNPPTSAQSTLSMRRKSLTGSDGLTALAKANNSELPLKAHPTHRAHSKSLDITATRAKNHMTDCEAAEVLVAEPASVDMPAKSESTPSDATAKKDESRRASYTSSSDSSDTDAESHASIINPTSRNSADSTSTPISPITAHGHCLMTIGKDVVENVENFRLKDDASTSNNSDDVQHLLSTSKTPDAAHTVPPMEVS